MRKLSPVELTETSCELTRWMAQDVMGKLKACPTPETKKKANGTKGARKDNSPFGGLKPG